MNDRLQNAVEAVWSMFDTAVSDAVKAYLELVNAVIEVKTVSPNGAVVTGFTHHDLEAVTIPAPSSSPELTSRSRTINAQVEPLEERTWAMRFSLDQLEEAKSDDSCAAALAKAVAGDLTRRLLGEIAFHHDSITWNRARERVDEWRDADPDHGDEAVMIVFSESAHSTFIDKDHSDLRNSLQPVREISTQHFGWKDRPDDVNGLMFFAPITGTMYSALKPTLGWDRHDNTYADIVVTEQSVLHIDHRRAAAPLRGTLPRNA